MPFGRQNVGAWLYNIKKIPYKYHRICAVVEHAQKLKKFRISTVYYFTIVQAGRPKLRVYIVQLSVMALVKFQLSMSFIGRDIGAQIWAAR